MRRLLFALLNCSLITALVTLGAATLNLLYLMFSSDTEVASKTGMFGAVSFESVKNADGSLSVQAGLESWTPLIVVWVILTLGLFASFLTYRWLKGYKARLIEASKRG
ncbi:hypothetical protein Aph02nite_09870 [Actinoplanes philippinensis]|uniref:Uncharacterized protein n=1 Tax=Actinoplanes philippinensis TaxID=35752 RepID=A0A1I2A7Z4_9ACTN|nr:hypothetical protein [Actinoplanes philippinensis]GIE75037.1 hypothetical protein Aph02nite_09870 [Actinoplanes philippinensis]SFE39849.1 hypothetical protein SAMN05421541_101555 [Actinoplanes philippinensis]